MPRQAILTAQSNSNKWRLRVWRVMPASKQTTKNVCTSFKLGIHIGKKKRNGSVDFGLDRSQILSRRAKFALDCCMPFQLESNYKPRGDQAQAIAKLAKSL